jgi:actin-related protein
MVEEKETISIIFDLGSYNWKIGLSGNDKPSQIFKPYILEKLINFNNNQYDYIYDINTYNNHLDYNPLSIMNINNGTFFKNFELFENYFDFVLNNLNNLNVDDNIFNHPFIFSEPCLCDKKIRMKLTEFLFEKYKIPSFFLCNYEVLSSFAFGKIICLIFDSGHNQTIAVPVNDGMIIKKSIKKSEVNGNFINNEIKKIIEQKFNLTLYSRYNNDYSLENFLSELKEKYINFCDDLTKENQNDNFEYILPDNNIIKLETNIRTNLINNCFKNNENNYSNIILNSINSVEIDIKKELCNQICLCGGNTILSNNFDDKIKNDIVNQVSNSTIVKVTKHEKEYRTYISWLGASILGSINNFSENLIKKEEYEEHGPIIIERKCA